MAHLLPPSWFICGQRGTGKSTLTAALLSVWDGRLALWVIDPCREHAVPSRGRRVRLPLSVWSRVDVAQTEAGKQLWQDTVNDQARALWDRADRSREAVMVLDDANACVLRGAQGPEAFTTCCVHEGRHAGIGFLVCCRRPSELPRDWSANAAHRAVFFQDEPGDLDYCRRLGIPEAARTVPALKRGQFWHRGPGQPWHMHGPGLDVPGVLDRHGALFPCLTAQ